MSTINLIKELAWSDFKLRYKGSLLGFFWSFLKPLLMLGVLYIVFGLILSSPVENYMLFLLLGIIVWNFFVESTTISMHNILEKKYLIRSVFFRREALVISSNLNAGFTFLFNIIIFFVLLFAYGIGLTYYIFIFLFMLMLLFMLSLGLSYILTALYVKYRDIIHIWEVFLTVGFWITPIAYSQNLVPERYFNLYMLNPLANIISVSRESIIYGQFPALWSMSLTFIICLAIWLLGRLIYKKLSRDFAEYI